MRISAVANFFFRRLLSKQRGEILESPFLASAPSLEDIQFATTTETLKTLQMDYHLLEKRFGELENLQRHLFIDTGTDGVWPEALSLQLKEPQMQALLDYVELRALILQEQIRQKN